MSAVELLEYLKRISEKFPTLAEFQTKHGIPDERADAGPLCEITAPNGYKIALLMMTGSARTEGDSFKAQTLQEDSWEDIIKPTYVKANGHFVFCFPCWKPDQDVGDGETVTFRLVAAGIGPFTGFVLYYLEEV